MNFIRAFLRGLLFSLGSIFYIYRCLFMAFVNGEDVSIGLRLRKEWFNILIKGLGVKVETYGEIPDQPGLLVCNHRSYFDPVIVLCQVLALPVGKSEVSKWPVIGKAGRVSGAIFVERKTAEGRAKARKEIVKTLKKGYSVINYAEGTTHGLPYTKDFKPAMFKDAATEGFAIYPVVHEYQAEKDAWVGNHSFVPHFFQCFGKKNTYIRISYGPALFSNSPEELMQQTKQWIDNEIIRLRKGWHETVVA